MLRTEPLKTGRPKNKPELKKLASERIRALQTAQKTTTQEKSWVEDGSEKNSVKNSHVEEKKEKAVFLSSKRSKTTKKNSWVDKHLTKPPKTMFWKERSYIECYKEMNHYELSGRRPKRIPYEKKEKKEKEKKKKKKKRH